MDESSRVETRLRAREAQGLEYSIWARIAFLGIGGAITISNSVSIFDTAFTFAILVATFSLMAWCLSGVRQQKRLLLIGRTLVASDALAILGFPIVWYVSVGGPESVSASYLIKNSQVSLYSVVMALNCLALRPVYPATVATIACVQMMAFALYAAMDERVALTSDNVEQVLGSGIKPGFVTWFFVATVLIGIFLSLATARARRTIREAAELEVENLHIREEQARRLMDAKIRALGGLVAGIAHEINTPLGVVASATATGERSAAQLARAVEEAQDLAELRNAASFQRAMTALREVSETTPKATRRINELVASLKDFARLDQSELAEVDVHECLERTLKLVSAPIKGRVQIVRHYGDIPTAHCRPHEMSQMLMTILVNAFEAMKGEGVLTLTTFAADGTVHLDIADTECGMTEHQVEHLFDVRFSDKSGRVGVRLGLPTARVIMEDQGGTMHVESNSAEARRSTWSCP